MTDPAHLNACALQYTRQRVEDVEASVKRRQQSMETELRELRAEVKELRERLDAAARVVGALQRDVNGGTKT